MMRHKILLLFLLFLFHAHVQAQQIDTPVLEQKYQAALQKGLQAQYKAYEHALKPTGLKQRVIAQTIINHATSPYPQDSIAYSYTGNRGSRFDFNSATIGYDEQLKNTLVPGPFSLLAESLKQYKNNVLRQTNTASYRPDKKVTLITVQNGGPDSFKVRNSYNTAGHAVTTDHTQYPGTGDPGIITRYSYNNSSQRTTDSSWSEENGSWQLISLWQYHYNTDGDLDTASFWVYNMDIPKLDNKSIYRYNNDGTLNTMIFYYHVSDTAVYSIHDTLGYTPGISYATSVTSARRYQDGPNRLEEERLQRVNYPDANGGMDSTRYYTWKIPLAQWECNRITRYNCNGFSNPETIREFKIVNQQEYHTRTFTFYYETYEETLGIAGKGKKSDFSVYPNPFANSLFVRCSDKTVSGVYQFQLMNMLGTTVWSERKAWNNNHASLTLSPALTPGAYLFQVLRNDLPVYTVKVIKE